MDAAWALGATKWEMIRTAVLPFGRAGIISAAMLGLGRALGETIAVALILSAAFTIRHSGTAKKGKIVLAYASSEEREKIAAFLERMAQEKDQ